ncbi:B12-binding domain-containing radical SAM protein [Thiorhodococcus mannitoliphagus]|uniref:B12-binding domain-containing radical SAM protein n=1 Tax=Thiorhodococcus mannitoliphagus TaxID=329406 RepID=A0A6P1DUD6_9GAMM|nr:radical SAM protein [Thiorhodococcus mannitoliphagus]NEX21708.1 B12-binding domain-containing radical SAM protein [Thiorhodococcus mannitoliphagus]
MIKKILLINMPNTVINDYDKARYSLDRQSISNAPYGLLSIISYVRKNSRRSAEIRLLDLNSALYRAYRSGKTNPPNDIRDAIVTELSAFSPDIVGVSIMFNVNYLYLPLVSAQVKKFDRAIQVIAGGNLATSMYEKLLEDENIDAVCYGEGEIPLTQIADSISPANTAISNHPSFFTSTKLQSENCFQPVNSMVMNLDTLPPINFDLLDLASYKGPMLRFFQRRKSCTESCKEDTSLKTLVIYTTRGCPYKCCFCACHVVHGKKIRMMSVEKVISDVHFMIDRYGINSLMINDDNFLLDKNRAIKILQHLIEMKMTVNFPSLLIRNIDDEIAALLSQVGVTNQLVSIESGSEYVLKHIIQKPLKIKEISRAVESLRRYGINVDTNVVTGFPGETDAHRQETLETIKGVGFNWSHFLIVLPVPGTSLYNECKEKNYLVDDENFFSPNLADCNISTPDYDSEHIQFQAYFMNLYANFIHNYHLSIGDYDTCIDNFSHVLQEVPGHAFAYYGLMRAYEGKSDCSTADYYHEKFKHAIREPYWSKYWNCFDIN